MGPLFGSKMRECRLDDSYARAHALTVAAVFHSVDRGMDPSFTVNTTQKSADIPERPLSLSTSPILRDPSDRVCFLSGLFYTMKSPRILFFATLVSWVLN